MTTNPDPEYTLLDDGRVRMRSQVRFKYHPESAQVVSALRAANQGQILWRWADDYIVSWPSKDDGIGIVEIVNIGPRSVALDAAHKMSVVGFVTVLGASHGSAEIAAVDRFEQAPKII
jgi:hypothetical protein